MKRLGSVLSLAACIAAACAVSACGSSSSNSGGGGAKAEVLPVDYQAPASGCGSFPRPAAKDPQNALDVLDKAHQENYSGYNNFPGTEATISPSAFKNFKKSDDGPYDVAIAWGQLVSDFQVVIVNEMKRYFEAQPNIGKVTVSSTSNNLDVGQQLQQFNSAIQAKPDIIVTQAASPAAFEGPINRAGKMGIPTITLLGSVSSPYAINLDGNNYLFAGGQIGSMTARLLNGKGNVFYVHGVAGSPVDNAEQAGWDAAFENCPGIKVSKDEVFGAFSTAVTKSEILKFLSTHPQQWDAVMQTAAMATGAMRAFEQTGKPMPLVPNIALEKAPFGYAAQNPSYPVLGTGVPPRPSARAIVEVAERIFAGQGPKINTMVGSLPIVTGENVSEWSEPGWTLATPGGVAGDPQSFLPSEYLNNFFTKPAPIGNLK